MKQVLEDGFKVTVLSRKGSSTNFPPSVTVSEIDYESPESLAKALEGQDAVVSAVGFPGLIHQLPLVEAAVKAGVKRFIPSEYGLDAENEKGLQMPQFLAKKLVQDALKKEAAAGTLTYTLISTGPFLDMAIRYGMFVNLKDKSAKLWNGGDSRFSTTTIASVAQAISGVLKHPEETKNRNVLVHNASTTQNELLAKAKKAVGAEGWTTEVAYTDDLLKKAYAALGTGQVDRQGFIIAAIFGEGYGCRFEKVDNELLGVKEFSDADIQNVVDGLAK